METTGERRQSQTHADPSGLETEVIFWEPVGFGASSFGHVSVRIDAFSYSFAPGGMDIRPAGVYFRMNEFRAGRGYLLNISPEDEASLAASLAGHDSSFNALSNNCTTPMQEGLWGEASEFLPTFLEARLLQSGLPIGSTSHPVSGIAARGHGVGLGDQIVRQMMREAYGDAPWLR